MVTPLIGRLLGVGFALYLLPALLMVLVVGALGILILAARRLVTPAVVGPVCYPRDAIGREVFRS